ncbi:hypothetical protein M0R45_020104 [Rubus argutus]|uniref:Uncharacterized protein n=1 Tax=Rubus argutus TaxID=59490 RepID=A0AAW1X926_RUBAR
MINNTCQSINRDPSLSLCFAASLSRATAVSHRTTKPCTTQLAYPCKLREPRLIESSLLSRRRRICAVHFQGITKPSPLLSHPDGDFNHLYVDPVPVLLICPAHKTGMASRPHLPYQPSPPMSLPPCYTASPILPAPSIRFLFSQCSLPRCCSHRSIRDQSSPASMPYTTTTSSPSHIRTAFMPLCAKRRSCEIRSERKKKPRTEELDNGHGSNTNG